MDGFANVEGRRAKNAKPPANAQVAAPRAAPAAPRAAPAASMFADGRFSLPTWSSYGPLFGSVLNYAFKAGLLSFILFLVLLLIHWTIYPIFSFTPGDGGIIPVPTASDRQLAYEKEPAAPTLRSKFTELLSCGYTIGMDVYLTGNFQTTQLPRVLLYRALEAQNPASTETESSLITRYGSNSNLIVWLDPVKNDLHVSVVSMNTNSVKVLSARRPIENVPLRKVFRVTVVFTPGFVETYINGKLRLTTPLTNPPIQVTEGDFYPVIAPAMTNAMIANLAYWPRVLTPKEVDANGAPMANETFFVKPAR